MAAPAPVEFLFDYPAMFAVDQIYVIIDGTVRGWMRPVYGLSSPGIRRIAFPVGASGEHFVETYSLEVDPQLAFGACFSVHRRFAYREGRWTVLYAKKKRIVHTGDWLAAPWR